jgi:antagonist of KipI
LFVEQQTTGGYPKIANVIGADLHRLGQLRPRSEIRFERTSLAVARSLWIEQERLLNTPAELFR